MPTNPRADLGAIIFCTLAWSTTWYAITLQLGEVDPVASVVYRFALAAGLLFLVQAVRRERLTLTRAQHVPALGMGVFQFALNYVFVYWAEERIASAAVAVSFASLAFINLALFRVVVGERASVGAWVAAFLGVAGIALLSWGELAQSAVDGKTASGLALALAAVVAAAVSNLFAHKGHQSGVPVATLTAWSMLYGVIALVVWGAATGIAWRFDTRAPYVLSLLYLSIVGSVLAFLLYYGLARRRGYALASYISALTPPIAMLVSTVFEGKTWTPMAIAGVAVVLSGQWLLMRSRKSPD